MSNRRSATSRECLRVSSASRTRLSIEIKALSYSWFVKSQTSAPTPSRVISASESPMPALIINGRPHPRYSAYSVGDEAKFETQGLMNANPASLPEREDGKAEGLAAL